MKNLLLFFCAFLLSQSVVAQSENPAVFYLVPKSEVLPVVVAQEDCPLTVESFLIVRNNQGMIQTEYKIRNNSTKDIESYRIARWYSDNTGFLEYGMMSKREKLFRPQMSVDTSLAKKIVTAATNGNKEASLKKIAFIMIVEINFKDGSSYDANSIFKSLNSHLKLFESTYDRLKPERVHD